MPKAILEFDLPEEQGEYRMAIDGPKCHAALWDFAEYLRQKLKYDENLSHEALVVYEEIQERFYEEVGSLLDY